MSSSSRNKKPVRHKQAQINSMFKVRPTPSISPTKQAAPTRDVMVLDEDCSAEQQGSKPVNVEYVILPDANTTCILAVPDCPTQCIDAVHIREGMCYVGHHLQEIACVVSWARKTLESQKNAIRKKSES